MNCVLTYIFQNENEIIHKMVTVDSLNTRKNKTKRNKNK